MGKGKKARSRIKTFRKLERKKELVAGRLRSKGRKLACDATPFDVLREAYDACGRTFKVKSGTPAGLHAHFANVMRWMELESDWKETCREAWARRPLPATPETVKSFYQSFEWRKLRYQVLKRDGARCCLCGASAAVGATLNVDHIKPLKHHWSLRLDPNNLQVLCGTCNHGKGNWDSTDWRFSSHQRTGTRD